MPILGTAIACGVLLIGAHKVKDMAARQAQLDSKKEGEQEKPASGHERKGSGSGSFSDRATRKHKHNLDDVVLISGSAHQALAEKISNHLEKKLMKTILSKFSNGESRVEFHEHTRGKDVFVIQSMVAVPERVDENGKVIPGKSLNDIFMETLLMIAAARGSSADRVTLLMPMAAYPRQDKKEKARVSVVGRLVADLFETAGIDRAITLDLHSSQIQGFYRKPLENIYCESYLVAAIESLMTEKGHRFEEGEQVDKLFVNEISNAPVGVTGSIPPAQPTVKRIRNDKRGFDALCRASRLLSTAGSTSDFVVISPHASGAKRATRVADTLSVDCAVLSSNKRSRDQREKGPATEDGDLFDLVGNVSGRICILVDDLTDTARTLFSAARFLKTKGAIEVHAFCLHGILSGDSIQTLTDTSVIESLTVTNSLPQADNQKQCPKLKVIDVSGLLAETIGRLHCHQSLAKMYQKNKLARQKKSAASPKKKVN